jgi:hypothetical protein
LVEVLLGVVDVVVVVVVVPVGDTTTCVVFPVVGVKVVPPVVTCDDGFVCDDVVVTPGSGIPVACIEKPY